MSLISEAKQAPPKRGPRCTVARLLAQLDPADAAEVVAALAADDVPITGLHAAMVNRGWDTPKAATLARHRRGECSCD